MHAQPLDEDEGCHCRLTWAAVPKKSKTGSPLGPLSGPPPCPAHQPRPGAQQGRWPMWPPHTNRFGAEKATFLEWSS